jgi:hypothetical protein
MTAADAPTQPPDALEVLLEVPTLLLPGQIRVAGSATGEIGEPRTDG